MALATRSRCFTHTTCGLEVTICVTHDCVLFVIHDLGFLFWKDRRTLVPLDRIESDRPIAFPVGFTFFVPRLVKSLSQAEVLIWSHSVFCGDGNLYAGEVAGPVDDGN